MKKAIGLILCIVLGVSSAVAADADGEHGQSFEAVHAYMKAIDLMTILAKYDSPDNMNAVKESDGKSFKKAIAAAGDKQKLVDALKTVRGAEISFIDHVSPATRGELDKAVGAAKVELELVE